MSRTYRKKSNKPSSRCFFPLVNWKNYSYKKVKKVIYSFINIDKIILNRQQAYFKEVYEFLSNNGLRKLFALDSIVEYNYFTLEELTSYFSEEEFQVISEQLGILQSEEQMTWIRIKHDYPRSYKPLEAFGFYKPKGNVKTYKLAKAVKADKKAAGQHIIFRKNDNYIFDICLCGCTNHERRWWTKEDFEQEPIDYYQEYEHYFGFNDLNWMYDEDESLAQLTPKVRKRTCTVPIWDDKLSSGVINKRKPKDFRKSIKYINSYINT